METKSTYVRSRRTIARFSGMIILVFACALASVRAQVFEWARQGGGFGWKHGNAIAADNMGNSFIAGEFSGTGASGNPSITFQDPGTNTYPLTTAGPTESFIVRYTSAGNIAWIMHPTVTSTTGSVFIKSIDADVDNAGQF